jgi:hypothetical protein
LDEACLLSVLCWSGLVWSALQTTNNQHHRTTAPTQHTHTHTEQQPACLPPARYAPPPCRALCHLGMQHACYYSNNGAHARGRARQCDCVFSFVLVSAQLDCPARPVAVAAALSSPLGIADSASRPLQRSACATGLCVSLIRSRACCIPHPGRRSPCKNSDKCCAITVAPPWLPGFQPAKGQTASPLSTNPPIHCSTVPPIL